MPGRIPAGDLKLFVIAGVVLALLLGLVAAFAPPDQSAFVQIASSYSSGSGGARAAFLLLNELDYQAERWLLSPQHLPTDPEEASRTLLVLADPFYDRSAADRVAVRHFLRAGGLVLGTGTATADLLPEARLDMTEALWSQWSSFRPQAASPLTRGVEEIRMPGVYRWEPLPGHVGLVGDAEGPVAVTYAHGEGRVIWWAASTPLTNAGLRERDNLRLFLNALGAPGERRILWDEYFHGYRDSLWSYFARTPTPWLLAQLGLLALAAFWTLGRRHGPVRAPAEESRLSPLEFVETVGGLYQRAGAGGEAVGAAADRFRTRLARRLALPRSASIAALHQGARERLGWREPGLFETLARAEKLRHDPELDAGEALRLVQALDHYLELLRLKPRIRQEKK